MSAKAGLPLGNATMKALWSATSGLALMFATSGSAFAETVTYKYDALGRVVTVGVVNGPANGTSVSYGYDPVGNRSQVAIGGSSTPTPTPAAGPGDVRNGSFGQPNVNGGYRYTPSVADNSFTAGAGVAGNGSGFDFPPAPDSNGQVGFVQGAGNSDGTPSAITLDTYGLTVGATYYVRFQISQRRDYLGNAIAVAAGNVALGSYTANSASWVQISTTSFTATASMMPISFTGRTNADQTTGIDVVEVLPGTGG